MKKPWVLETGEVVTVAELAADARNRYGVGVMTIYKRLRAGDRTIARLLRRPADHSAAGRAGRRYSHWSNGPHCKSPGARESWSRLNASGQ